MDASDQPLDPSRRLAATGAIVLTLAVAALVVVTALRSFPGGLVAAVLVVAGITSTAAGIGRRRSPRAVLVGFGLLLFIGAVIALITAELLVEMALLVGLIGGATACMHATFGPLAVGLRSAPDPRRPVLIFNPASGGGKAERLHLADEAAARGIEAIGLRPGDDLVQLARDAVASGADALAAAGGDGTQALVAAVAAEHNLPFACIPAGTRNHFALDLGVDRNDVLGALDAFVDGLERTVDLAEMNGRVFVNNASLGVYASAVQKSDYRGAKLATLLDTAPDVVGPRRAADGGFTWTAPDGSHHGPVAVLLVSNNPYRLVGVIGAGTRPRLDGGTLGIVATHDPGVTGRAWSTWSGGEFVIGAGSPVAVGVDGEALMVDPPVVFRIRPAALRVRIARAHPGGSPSSGAPTGFVDAFRRLIGIARGVDPFPTGRPR